MLLVSTVAWFRVPLLPAVGDELAMTPTGVGWAVTLFGVGRLAMDLPAGRLADRIDPLRLFTASALVLCVASALLAVAGAPGWVLPSGFLLGAASATGNTTGMTAVSGAAPAERRGTAMALYSGALLVGQALGPALAGVVTASAPGVPPPGPRRPGAGGRHRGGSLPPRGLGARLVRARRERQPPDGPPLTSQQVVLFGVGFSVFFTVGSMPQTLLPLIGSGDLGLTTTSIGLALGAGGLARLAGAAIAGGLSDRVSRRAALMPCLVVQAAGVAVLAAPEGGPGGGWRRSC